MHEFSGIAAELNERFRADDSAERGGDESGNAGLHVLGGRVPRHPDNLHHTPERLRRRHGRGRDGPRSSGADVAAAAAIAARGLRQRQIEIFDCLVDLGGGHNGSNGGGPVDKLLNVSPQTLGALNETLRSVLGVDLNGLLNRGGVGSQLTAAGSGVRNGAAAVEPAVRRAVDAVTDVLPPDESGEESRSSDGST